MKLAPKPLALILLLAAQPAIGTEVQLTIAGFASEDGQARIVLMEGIEGYTSERPVTLIGSAPIAGGTAIWSADLPEGTYSIIAHHDRDGNDDLNRPFFSLPLEPYGYSNDAWTSLGLPDYDAVAFTVGEESVDQQIRLRTNLFVTLAQVILSAGLAIAGLFGGVTLLRRFRRTSPQS